jgi:hypothetical protein
MSHLPKKRTNGAAAAAPTVAPAVNYREIELSELLDKYDLSGVSDSGTITAVEKGSDKRFSIPELEEHQSTVTPQKAVSSGEIKVGGETLYRRARMTDYNPELSGQSAFDLYGEMKNDSIVRTTLKMAKTPVLSARWFVEPASNEQIDLEVAEFVEDNLNNWLNVSFDEFLIQSLTCLDYGVAVFEKVFDTINWGPKGSSSKEQKIYWRKFAPRAVESIDEFVYDDEGGPETVIITTEDGPVDLDIWKALIVTYDKEDGDLWGHSVLRSAYKHWFYKEQLYKIDAIQKERHGIGIPIIVLPPNFSPQDRVTADNIGQSLRTNERAHVTLPPGWEVYFLKLEGQRVDALESAQHHADKLYENIMANFIQRSTHSGETNVQQETFVKSVRFVAETIRNVINKYAIPQLVNFNWDTEQLAGYPRLRVRRLGDERDWRVLSFAMRNLVGANILRVDDRLEEWVREEMDMPMVDEETVREVLTPQAPGGARVGPPRQATPDRQEVGKSAGRQDFGQDNSGTSQPGERV